MWLKIVVPIFLPSSYSLTDIFPVISFSGLLYFREGDCYVRLSHHVRAPLRQGLSEDPRRDRVARGLHTLHALDMAGKHGAYHSRGAGDTEREHR